MKKILMSVFFTIIVLILLIYFIPISKCSSWERYRIDNTNRIISRIPAFETVKYLKKQLEVEAVYADETLTEEIPDFADEDETNDIEEDNEDEDERDHNFIKTGMCIQNRGITYKLCVAGDFDGDGNANQIELSKMIKYIVGTNNTTLTELEKASADFNGDGLVDQRDISKFVMFMVYNNISFVENKANGTDEWMSEKTRIIELKANNTNWTNSSIQIEARAIDDISGIIAYQFSTLSKVNARSDGWNLIENTKEEISINNDVYENGTYYLHIMNNSGKITTESIEIRCIDTKNPVMQDIIIPEIARDNLNITTKISDDGSGLAEFVINYKKQDETEYIKEKITFSEVNGKNTGSKEFNVVRSIHDIESGIYNIYFELYDVAGNKVQTSVKNFEMKNTIAQIGEQKYDSIQNAINSITTADKTTIVLMSNTSENIIIPTGKKVVIQTLGHTLTGKTGAPAITINNNAELEYNMGKVAQTGEETVIKNDEGGKLSLSGVNISSEAGIAIDNGGALSINGGEIASNGETTILNNGTINTINAVIKETGNGIAILNNTNKSLTMISGTITNEGNGIALKNEGTAIIAGGTIENIGEGKALENSEGADIQIGQNAIINGTSTGIPTNEENISGAVKNVLANLLYNFRQLN